MKTLRLHFLQHVSFEGPGYIETWAKQNKHTLTSTKFYKQEELPNLDTFDWLIIMGGPMSVGDEADYVWLKPEKQFIQSAINAGKTVLGICLGAQLIANVLGAKVYPNKKKEIGWFSVTVTDDAIKTDILKNIPPTMTVLHWHGDTFDIPDGAVHLIKTEICPNQAFIYNKTVLGLQFHLEATPVTLEQMMENCHEELVADDFVQTENKILSNSTYCASNNKHLTTILDNLVLL